MRELHREYDEYMRTICGSRRDAAVWSAASLLEGKSVHIPDVLADPEYTQAEPQDWAAIAQRLGVPLLREGSPIGVIGLQRATCAAIHRQSRSNLQRRSPTRP